MWHAFRGRLFDGMWQGFDIAHSFLPHICWKVILVLGRTCKTVSVGCLPQTVWNLWTMQHKTLRKEDSSTKTWNFLFLTLEFQFCEFCAARWFEFRWLTPGVWDSRYATSFCRGSSCFGSARGSLFPSFLSDCRRPGGDGSFPKTFPIEWLDS